MINFSKTMRVALKASVFVLALASLESVEAMARLRGLRGKLAAAATRSGVVLRQRGAQLARQVAQQRAAFSSLVAPKLKPITQKRLVLSALGLTGLYATLGHARAEAKALPMYTEVIPGAASYKVHKNGSCELVMPSNSFGAGFTRKDTCECVGKWQEWDQSFRQECESKNGSIVGTPSACSIICGTCTHKHQSAYYYNSGVTYYDQSGKEIITLHYSQLGDKNFKDLLDLKAKPKAVKAVVTHNYYFSGPHIVMYDEQGREIYRQQVYPNAPYYDNVNSAIAQFPQLKEIRGLDGANLDSRIDVSSIREISDTSKKSWWQFWA